MELIGTPAEEGGGGKIRLLEAGVFEGVDAAMMFHPFDRDLVTQPTLASVWIEMRFKGTPSHAALAPWEGSSALTACLETFRLVDSQRVHFRDGVRVHGFVTNGGQAVNIIPELAAAEFSVRAKDMVELAACGPSSSAARTVRRWPAGWSRAVQREGYKDMRNNMTVARRFGAHCARWVARGEGDDTSAPAPRHGESTPCPPSTPGSPSATRARHCHQNAFAVCAGSERACSPCRAAIDGHDRRRAGVQRSWCAPRARSGGGAGVTLSDREDCRRSRACLRGRAVAVRCRRR